MFKFADSFFDATVGIGDSISIGIGDDIVDGVMVEADNVGDAVLFVGTSNDSDLHPDITTTKITNKKNFFIYSLPSSSIFSNQDLLITVLFIIQ